MLGYANLVLQGTEGSGGGLCSLPQRGWPLAYYSNFYNFYGYESHDWGSLTIDVVTAAVMLAATGWVVESWVRRRYRITLPAVVGLTCVAGILAVGIYSGIISFSRGAAPGGDCAVRHYFRAISESILGRRLQFDMYGDDWWEYIPYSVLLFGIGCIVCAAGRVLLLPFKILTPGPFRWRRGQESN